MNELTRLKPVKRARIGLYSAGLEAYWSQFDGLHDRLVNYGNFIEQRLSVWGDVFNFGLVDNEQKGHEAGAWFNQQNVDIIFSHSATYYTSSTVLPIHQICKATVVILNLQPTASMNYMKTSTGEWLAQCVGCPVPELSNAFHRANIDYHIVNGLLGLEKNPDISVSDEVTSKRPEAIRAWNEIEAWSRAAGVKRTLQNARFGFLGNNYSGMLDMYSDFTMIQAQTGIHIEILEMCDLNRCLKQVSDSEINEKVKQIESFFRIEGDSPSDAMATMPTTEQLHWSAQVAASQERMIREHNLDSISYYYHGSNGNEYEQLQSGFIVGHSLLTAKGIPCAGEGDIKTALAMKICDTLDMGGSFCEIVAMDYNVGSIIMGHDGPFHIKIAAQKPILRSMGVYHGKRGHGVSVEAEVLPGDVTLLGISQTVDGRLKMIISEGIAVKEPILMIGNTQTHIKFALDPDAYMDKWFQEAPTHHLSLSIGKNKGLYEKVAILLGIESVTI